jgi:hypothetical protein
MRQYTTCARLVRAWRHRKIGCPWISLFRCRVSTWSVLYSYTTSFHRQKYYTAPKMKRKVTRKCLGLHHRVSRMQNFPASHAVRASRLHSPPPSKSIPYCSFPKLAALVLVLGQSWTLAFFTYRKLKLLMYMFTCMSMEVSALRITLYYKLLIKLYFLEFF